MQWPKQKTESISWQDETAAAVLDRRRLQALGVLLPIRLTALSFFAGRHTLGRAGDGMRYLRTRPFESGQDNPRDIDKFSPPGELWINESEAEAQASITLLADVSASMSFGPKTGLLNLALLQLTYSLWRASDRVKTILFHADSREEFAERNLKSQLERLIKRLDAKRELRGADAIDVLLEHASTARTPREDLLFLLSDFCPLNDADEVDDLPQWRSAQRMLACDVIPVIVSFELAAEQRGLIRLWDPERGEQQLTLLTPARIARINRAESQRVDRLRQRFRRLGLDHVVLRRDQDVYPELAQLARWRRRHSA